MTAKQTLALSLLFISLAGCSPSWRRTPDPDSGLSSPSPQPSTLTPGGLPSPPPLDPADLLADPPPRPFDFVVVNPDPPLRVPNATRTFWVRDSSTGELRQITARLRAQTEHAAMWVEQSVWHDVRKIEKAALEFDSLIYPAVVSAFGSEWIPGVDNDPHVHILHADLGEGVLAYTSSANELPADVYEYSNEAELILIQAVGLEPGSSRYMALLARELQRLVQWYGDRNEDRWIRDALADLAVPLCGLEADALQDAYLDHPDAPLTAWIDRSTAARGAGYLLGLYFQGQHGEQGTRLLTSEPLNGFAGFNAALAELGADLTFEDVLADWLAATYLDHMEGVELTRYSYPAADVARPAVSASIDEYPASLEGTVHQFGADYILLRAEDDLRIQFTGATSTPLLDLPPHSGQRYWWTIPADESLATLSRSFSLTGTTQATLEYWTWFDTESGCDCAQVEASADGGESWETLVTASGSPDQACSYSGRSGGGPVWIPDEADLSEYAGGDVIIRFSYLTDGAVLGLGFAVDDISIRGIDYLEGAEGDNGGWEARGFVRAGLSVQQRYLILLIGLGEEVTVRRLSVGADQTAEWVAPLAADRWGEAIVVVSGLAPITPQAAPYVLTIQQESPGS